jgi:hypothetical protein
MKLFDTKLYFTCILILEVEKEKRNSSKKLQRKEKISESQLGICSKKPFNKRLFC